jgi:hypothetical protein
MQTPASTDSTTTMNHSAGSDGPASRKPMPVMSWATWTSCMISPTTRPTTAPVARAMAVETSG